MTVYIISTKKLKYYNESGKSVTEEFFMQRNIIQDSFKFLDRECLHPAN